MGNTVLIIFLILYGLVALGLGIPLWVVGVAALLAGVLLLVGR